MKENIFVFRISKGNDSGNPKGHCPLDYSQIKNVISNLKEDDIEKIDYDKINYVEYLHKELWNNNVLRQGWGIKDLDLNQDIKSWIEKYMLNAKKFWNQDIDCHQAKGRWNILSRMLDIQENDYIFIPKTSNNIENINDYKHFTICQVQKKYYFDYNNNIKDFGHCIEVKNLKVFEYSKETLFGKDFSSPYISAVMQVKKKHSRYMKFKEFIELFYNQ